MRIVFGWNNFRIKSFHPTEIGLTTASEPGFRIELRQSYFHLFWIPFFGLGKKWAIRKEGKLYELPAAYLQQVRPLARTHRTPWYTFAGPLLILAGGLIFWGYSEYEEYQYRQRSISYFNRNRDWLEDQLKHLSNRDIISLREMSQEWWNEKLIYAKVEQVEGDKITVTPVSAASEKPMEVEASYNRFGEQTARFDISLSQLLAAYPKKYDSSSGKAMLQYGRPLMNNERSYIVKEVVRHFGPIISNRHTGSYGMTEGGWLRMELTNAGWPAIISAVKAVEGTADWSENIGKEVNGNQTDWAGSFSLGARNYKPGDHYKIHLTLTDSSSKAHVYEIEGANLESTVRELAN